MVREMTAFAAQIQRENDALRRRLKLAEVRAYNAAIHIEMLRKEQQYASSCPESDALLNSLKFRDQFIPMSWLPKLPKTTEEFRYTFNTLMAEVSDVLSAVESLPGASSWQSSAGASGNVLGQDSKMADLELRMAAWLSWTSSQRLDVFLECQVSEMA